MKKTTYTQLAALKCIIDDNDRVFECDNWVYKRILKMNKEENEIQMIYDKDDSICYYRHNLDSIWTEVIKEKDIYKDFMTAEEVIEQGIVIPQGAKCAVTDFNNRVWLNPSACFDSMRNGKMYFTDCLYDEEEIRLVKFKYVKLLGV